MHIRIIRLNFAFTNMFLKNENQNYHEIQNVPQRPHHRCPVYDRPFFLILQSRLRLPHQLLHAERCRCSDFLHSRLDES